MIITYYFKHNDQLISETDLLFINGSLSTEDINKIISHYENLSSLKLICIIGNIKNVKKCDKYRVWLDDEGNTSYDNGFINTYDILCRGFGDQFRNLNHNISFTYSKDTNSISNAIMF